MIDWEAWENDDSEYEHKIQAVRHRRARQERKELKAERKSRNGVSTSRQVVL